MNITVLGAGSWGTALARLLCLNGHQVTLQSWQPDHVAEMRRERENRQFLPGVALPERLDITGDMAAANSGDMVVFSVPSPALASVARQALPYVRQDAILISTAKGFFQDEAGGAMLRLSQVLRQTLPGRHCVALSGPSHAEEVGQELITAVTVAGDDPPILKQVQEAFSNDYFRVYTNNDLIGVEVGAAVKNIIAVGAGLLTGLGQGDNAKAALMTRGLAEITRLGVALGAEEATFAGLAGIGDLIVTCTSENSRNFRAGREIGQGRPVAEVIGHMGMVVEGVYAAQAVHQLAQSHQVEMPICQQIYGVLYEGADPDQAMRLLMLRERKEER